MNPLIIAITLGDPGGIGPEIALKAAYRTRWPRAVRLVLIGSRAVLRAQARRLRLPLPPAWTPAHDPARRLSVPIVNWDPPPDAVRPAEKAARRPLAPPWRPGHTGPAEGRAAAAWIRAAVSGCLDGRFDAMVTGPICKSSLRLARLPYPGHTEYLAALTGARRFAMLLMGGPLRVVLATRHLPLARVPAALTRNGLMETVRLTAQAIAWLGVKPPAIGVCALNPHAGDDGLLGREEITVLRPALRALRREGVPAEGPIPGDVIFHQARQGRFGAVVAMYHDQGLAPLKMLAFETGINLTLGLPLVRTSPDHGTAFDIAGRGIARPDSLIAAIRLAAVLARKPNPWAPGSKNKWP